MNAKASNMLSWICYLLLHNQYSEKHKINVLEKNNFKESKSRKYFWHVFVFGEYVYICLHAARVGTRICGDVCAPICTCVHVEARSWHHLVLSPIILHNTYWSKVPRICPTYLAYCGNLSLWLMNAEMTNDCHTCYVGSGAQESGPHTCTRSALSTMSSFQPKSQISVTHNSSVFELLWAWRS